MMMMMMIAITFFLHVFIVYNVEISSFVSFQSILSDTLKFSSPNIYSISSSLLSSSSSSSSSSSLLLNNTHLDLSEIFTWTGKKVDLGKWQSQRNPVSVQQEIEVTKVLVKPGEYISSFYLPEERISEIEEKCNSVHMQFDQALSLRKQLLVHKISNEAWKITKGRDNFERLYRNGRDILDISKQFDVPPVATLRSFFTKIVDSKHPTMRYRDKVTIVRSILREDPNLLSEYISHRDLLQLQSAKIYDQSSYSEDGLAERTESMGWENSLYAFLTFHNINYVKEEVLMSVGTDKISSTPDCVILDDMYINGKLVRWIDCKNFYGSCKSRVFIDKLLKQSKKYDNYFQGTGAVIYKLGYSIDLVKRVPNTLLLDEGSLHRM